MPRVMGIFLSVPSHVLLESLKAKELSETLMGVVAIIALIVAGYFVYLRK